jgi:hypothetical protein
MKNYNLCKSKFDITKYKISDISNYINKSTKGTRSLFEDLIMLLKNNNSSLTVSEMAQNWRKRKVNT